MADPLDLLAQLVPQIKQDRQELQGLQAQLHGLEVDLRERDEALANANATIESQDELIAALRSLNRRKDSLLAEATQELRHLRERLGRAEANCTAEAKARNRAEADRLRTNEATAVLLRENEEHAAVRIAEADRRADEEAQRAKAAEEVNNALIQRIRRLRRRALCLRKERDEAREKNSVAEDDLAVERYLTEYYKEQLEPRPPM